MYTIGVTGTGSLIGQAIIKSIIRSPYKNDYKVIGFDYFQNTVGSFWCNKCYILPDLLKPNIETEWIESLFDIISNEKIAVLFVGIDFELPVLAKYKKEIEAKTKCLIIASDENVIRIGNDKYLTYKFLKENGLGFPKTYLPEELIQSELSFPMIVKPRIGARSIGVNKIFTIEELNNVLTKIKNPIIQECIGNDSDEYTCGVISLNNQIKKMIVLNRSLKAGNTYIAEFRKDYSDTITIYQYIKKIAELLQPFGSCNFQLRLDNNNIPKLFEINPRHSGTTYIRSLFGYNEVIYILKYLLENVEIDFNLKEGRTLRYFEEVLI